MDWTRWPNFAASEFACACCGRADMDPEFMDRLQALRTEFGAPMRVSSGYRCADHNERVSTTGRDGPHTTGKACDVLVSGERAHALLRLAFAHGFAGIGVAQKGPHGQRFVHLDAVPRLAIWSY